MLFTDAANADLRVLRRSLQLPERLLLIALPITFLLGAVTARLIFDDVGWLELTLLAIILAPTDATLGKAVVTNPHVPARLRDSLNVESGLNDILCVPLLLGVLALATDGLDGSSAHLYFLHEFVFEIGIGAAVGLVVAALGAYAVRFAVAGD